MEEYPSIFNRSKLEQYICACNTWFRKDQKEDAMDHFYSGRIDGYCANGIKRLEISTNIWNDMYECVCGFQADRCDICDIHFKRYGKSCMTGRNRKEESYCEKCDLQCSSVCDYNKHCDTKKHKNNTPISLECDICKIKCISEFHISRHLQTKKHKDMVESGKVSEEKISLHCETCNITCPSQATMKTHLQTKKHMKKKDTIS
jgi:hypothetical protein